MKINRLIGLVALSLSFLVSASYADEKSNLRAVRKSCISALDILKGEKITKKHINFKRPGTGINPFDYKKFINKRAKKFIEKDRILKLKDFK